VLAAGKGRRIESVAPELPKSLLPVLDRPLVAWQLEALREVGIRDVVVVIGHHGGSLAQELGDGRRFGVRVTTVEQTERLGIAHALTIAAPLLERPFVCLLGDIFFERADLARLVRAFDAGTDAVLGVRGGETPRDLAQNYAVELDPGGWVRSVLEKPSDGRSGLKGVGLYLFRPAFLAVARETPRSALRGEHELTDAIGLALERGARIRGVELAGRDFNLSEPADLLAVNLHALALAGRASWISSRASVEDGAEIEASVVLDGARVSARARLERSLVLADQVVGPGVYRETLFAAGRVVSCSPADGRR